MTVKDADNLVFSTVQQALGCTRKHLVKQLGSQMTPYQIDSTVKRLILGERLVKWPSGMIEPCDEEWAE